MKRSLLLFFSVLSHFVFAQNNEIIVNDSAQYGFHRPRLALLSNNIPFVLWGKYGTFSKIYGAKLVGSSFTAPVQIDPDTMDPRVGTFDGPNLVAYNDSIYVVWENMASANHHVFMNRSLDGGATFGPVLQVDGVTNSDNLEYPGISVSNNGTLGIYYIRSDASFNNPKQCLVTSFDRGNTFSPDTVVNTFAPGQPCECCQGNMAMQDSNWVYYYRNNVNDIRNVHTLVSTDYGATFNGVYEMDLLDWYIQTCPSSGPEGYVNGNTSFVAWMSKGSGSSRVLYGLVDTQTGILTTGNYIDATVASGVVQNYPAVDGVGDTVAVVWQDNRYIFSQIFASISTDGGQSFSGTILISDTSVVTTYQAPDVAYANGIFHFVWRTSSKIYYKSATLNTLLSVAQNASSDHAVNVYPNPFKEQTTLYLGENVNGTVGIYNVSGQLVKELSVTNRDHVEISNQSMPTGIYMLRYTGEDGITISRKLVVTD